MMIHEITAQAGAHKKRKRIGRGESSGHGKTSTRGTKGSGAAARQRDQGRLRRRQHAPLPPPPEAVSATTNSASVSASSTSPTSKATSKPAPTIDASALIAKGLVRDERYPVKILGDGELTKKFTIIAGKFTKQAAEKITKAGGTVQALELDRNKNKVNPKTGKFRSQKPEAKKKK